MDKFVQLLRLLMVKKKTGLSRSSIYNRLNESSPYWDPTFPKPVKIGMRAVAWREHEIDAWIKSLSNASIINAQGEEAA